MYPTKNYTFPPSLQLVNTLYLYFANNIKRNIGKCWYGLNCVPLKDKLKF